MILVRQKSKAMKQSTITNPEKAILDLEYLNNRLTKTTPKNILSWSVSNFPTGLVQVSNFTIDDLVVTDILYGHLKPKTKIPVIFIDTLHHFSETLTFVEKAQQFYNLDLKIYGVAGVHCRQSFAAKYGKALWEKNPAKFNYLTKVEPLERALTELNCKAWINCLYPSQPAEFQDSVTTLEWDSGKRLQINALNNWNRTESWAYAYEYDLIYNPLYDLGYSTIGEQLNFDT